MHHLPYIFLIGFNKCGTTSLHEFFVANGFPSVHWDNGRLALRMLHNCINDVPVLDGYADRYRVFSDATWSNSRMTFEANSLFRVIDRDYPDSYFIYQTRPMNNWLESRIHHGGRTSPDEFDMKRINAISTDEVVREWRREREFFEDQIADYFSGHSRFCWMDIEVDDVPSKISSLLGIPMERKHWRRLNASESAPKAPV